MTFNLNDLSMLLGNPAVFLAFHSFAFFSRQLFFDFVKNSKQLKDICVLSSPYLSQVHVNLCSKIKPSVLNPMSEPSVFC